MKVLLQEAMNGKVLNEARELGASENKWIELIENTARLRLEKETTAVINGRITEIRNLVFELMEKYHENASVEYILQQVMIEILKIDTVDLLDNEKILAYFNELIYAEKKVSIKTLIKNHFNEDNFLDRLYEILNIQNMTPKERETMEEIYALSKSNANGGKYILKLLKIFFLQARHKSYNSIFLSEELKELKKKGLEQRLKKMKEKKKKSRQRNLTR